jgi:hypothetical protein
LAVQWLNEALCFVSSSVVADSFVLRNRQLLVGANRYKQGYEDHANNEKQKADKRQKPAQTDIGLFDRPLFDLLKNKLTWRLNKVLFVKK